MAPGTNEDLMLRPQVKAQTHPPLAHSSSSSCILTKLFKHRVPVWAVSWWEPPSFALSGSWIWKRLILLSQPPLCLRQRGGRSGEQRPDTAAGQARIYARDKTGNRKETTQSPTLPDVTQQLLIFLDGREKNVNNIRCSIGEGEGGLKGGEGAGWWSTWLHQETIVVPSHGSVCLPDVVFKREKDGI